MIIHFNFEHSSLPTSFIKQNKNNWANNCMQESYDLVQFYHKPLLNLPHNLGKRTKTVKNTKKLSFFPCLSTSLCWHQSQRKLKSSGHATACGSLVNSYNSNTSHYFTCPKAWGKGPKRLKILRKYHFLQLLPAYIDQKIKTISHSITCHILIISRNPNISHSMTCPKFWRKRPTAKNT